MSSNPEQELAFSSLRRHLRPRDQAVDLHGFITTAAQRAIPLPPKFETFELSALYSYDAASYHSYFDPSNGEGKPYHGRKEYSGPLVAFLCGQHRYIELGPVLDALHPLAPDAAVWMVHLLNELPGWVNRPEWWRGFVEHSYWQGEADEEQAKADMGEDYFGPTAADIEALYPTDPALNAALKGKKSHLFVAGYVSNLRQSAVLSRHGVDTSGLLDEVGRPLADYALTAGCTPADCCLEPVSFGLRKGDWIEKSIDDMKETGAQCGADTDAFAWIPAGHLGSRFQAAIAHNHRLFAGLDKLCISLIKFTERHAKIKT